MNILTPKTVALYRDLARRNFINTPANLVWPDCRPLTEGDFVGSMQLKAALSVLQSMGLIDKSVCAELNEPFVEDFKDE